MFVDESWVMTRRDMSVWTRVYTCVCVYIQGPVFDELDDTLQQTLREYLAARGITPELGECELDTRASPIWPQYFAKSTLHARP